MAIFRQVSFASMVMRSCKLTVNKYRFGGSSGKFSIRSLLYRVVFQIAVVDFQVMSVDGVACWMLAFFNLDYCRRMTSEFVFEVQRLGRQVCVF